MKIPNKLKLQQIALNDSSDSQSLRLNEALQRLYQQHTHFLGIDKTLPSYGPLGLRKNLL